jgi:hypothetical protein
VRTWPRCSNRAHRVRATPDPRRQPAAGALGCGRVRIRWHPHNAEILSGRLVARGIPQLAERAPIKSKINRCGWTWRTWHSRDGVQPGGALPLGPAMSPWLFDRDGEVRPGLVESRDARMRIDTSHCEAGQDLVALARPQLGVDLLREHFPMATPIPGVVDAGAADAGATPPAVPATPRQ